MVFADFMTDKAVREIKASQRSANLQIPKLSFTRLVREVMADQCADLGYADITKMGETALLALQEVAEAFMVCEFASK